MVPSHQSCLEKTPFGADPLFGHSASVHSPQVTTLTKPSNPGPPGGTGGRCDWGGRGHRHPEPQRIGGRRKLQSGPLNRRKVSLGTLAPGRPSPKDDSSDP
jgi:hypothetical protein